MSESLQVEPPEQPATSLFEREFQPAREHAWRNLWYRLIFHHEAPAEHNFDLLLILTILASVVVVMVDSVNAIKLRWHEVLFVAEWVFTALFTVEYLLRLWVVRRPLRYATSFFGVIDLLAIPPTCLSLLLVGSNYLIVIRVLRLLHVFRVLKLVEYSSEAGLLIGSLIRSSRKISVFIRAVITIVIIFGSLMYVIEGPEHGFTSIPTSMYRAMVTMTTVGFGDIAPATPLGRLITSILILIGYSIIAVPADICTAEPANTLRPNRRAIQCTHVA